MQFVDVVESLIPGFKAFVLERYDLLAKATPESTLSIAANTEFLTALPYDLVVLE